MTLTKIGSKTVCGFDFFDVSPKGTEAKGGSNLLALLIHKFKIPKNTDKSFIMVLTEFGIKKI